MFEINETALAIPQASVKRSNAAFEFLCRLVREKPLGAAGALICVIFLFAGIFADLYFGISTFVWDHAAPDVSRRLSRLKPANRQMRI
ncbi:hypothetical protein [Bradyrhizobium sp. CB2312]|uniref:hypothetical protein n=1 Tax=Bradyrhizobium sp. CB2312 TaxID=3039155 RepID=UPI0024B26DC1|nr:hypothetical protein [Bradyrhizobium sp. CB2312]WFU71259.1 hypothetical protein QA642_39580 [Bradyrhizobium sp. CB2312]